jgi:hypothetical protein
MKSDKVIRELAAVKPHHSQKELYNRWYYARRKLGLPTRDEFKTPLNIRKRNMKYYYDKKKK